MKKIIKAILLKILCMIILCYMALGFVFAVFYPIAGLLGKYLGGRPMDLSFIEEVFVLCIPLIITFILGMFIKGDYNLYDKFIFYLNFGLCDKDKL